MSVSYKRAAERAIRKDHPTMKPTHDAGPWIEAKTDDAIVAPNADRRAMSPSAFDYYGGFVIAESVAPWNRPIIKAAPEMLTALADLEAEISARFTSDYERAPEYMTEHLKSKVLAARDALAKGRGETQ